MRIGPIPRNVRLVATLVVLLLAWFALMRAGLIARNAQGMQGLSILQVLSSFVIGARFDCAVACYLLLPFCIVGVLPRYGWNDSPLHRRIFVVAFSAAISALTMLVLCEFEFFREFQTRYNQLALQYWQQAGTVAGMIWKTDYPFGTYLLAWASVSAIWALAIRWTMRRIFRQTPDPRPSGAVREISAIVGIFVLLVFGMRGGLQGEPLHWGDAYRSSSEFINQMSLNGVYTLGVCIKDWTRHSDRSSEWMDSMPEDQAREIVRKMLAKSAPTPAPDSHGAAARWASLRRTAGRTPNVVVVIMESFSARFVGAAGSPDGMTPYFDRLAADGVFFDRAFSAGTHTHQGVFATLLGFPNLPGYEYLMQTIAANQPFASLPALLKQEGYATLFLYNGNFAWDNMRGFFQKQGFDRFIGAGEIKSMTYADDVWGVCDRDVFDQANREFEQLNARGPFFATILTLSNHAPFNLPPLPFSPTTHMADMNKRCDGIRYADWAIGQFIEQAKQMDYYRNTLFVFVGDHGFHVPPVMSELHLLYHHVPLLFYAPELLDARGMTRHEVASQVNVLPTILGLLGVDRPQAGWGRDLLSRAFADDNFALIKGSGGDRAVGMIRGDQLLVIGTDSKKHLFRYDLAFPPTLTPLAEDDVAYQAAEPSLEQQLRAYTQCALMELTRYRVGSHTRVAYQSTSPR